MIKTLKITGIFLLFYLCYIIGYAQSSYENEDLQKYRPLEETLQQTSKHAYDFNSYNCVDFSKDGQVKLASKGISSSIIVGTRHTATDHAYLGIWIDPQNGSFVQDYEFVKVMEGNVN
jgi:hypothetical protein